MTKPTIGFIGLGLMGGNMVENLQNRGCGGIKLVRFSSFGQFFCEILSNGSALISQSKYTGKKNNKLFIETRIKIERQSRTSEVCEKTDKNSKRNENRGRWGGRGN